MSGKLLLIFRDGDLFQQIRYTNKKTALRHYRLYLKHGVTDAMTGEQMTGTFIYELI
jgi:hypothetical protein